VSVKYKCDLCKEDIAEGEFWGQITISASNNTYHIHQHCEKILHNLFTSEEKPTIIITDDYKEERLLDNDHSSFLTKKIEVRPGQIFTPSTNSKQEYEIVNHGDESVYFSVTTKKESNGSN